MNGATMIFADTLGEELRRSALRYAAIPAFCFHGRERSFAEWERRSARFARALLAHGVAKGDRVALLLPPVPDYMDCYLGAARIGAITAGISTRYRGSEIEAILASADPRAVVTVERVDDVDFVEVIAAARARAPSLRAIVRFAGAGTGTLEQWLATGDAAAVDLAAAEAAVGARDPVAIIYTSGTTGVPKGAVYDAAAMTALTRLVLTRSTGLPPPGTPTLWPGMSLTHVGAMARVHMHLALGGTMVLHDRFDPVWCLEQIVRLRPARIGGFPPVLMRLVRAPERRPLDLSFLREVHFGGAPLALPLVEEIERELGVTVYTGYSCTETGVISATLPGDSLEARRTTVGRPTPGVEVRIVDAERQSVAAGEAGRIAVRSPATMREYWRDPAATARALDADGWLYTEDMGYLDADKYLHLLGREADMYFRAAFNVYPAEVERVLQTHPRVAQAAVVGVPDDVLGEKGWAVVVPTDPRDPPTLAELRVHVGAALASYKRPDGLTIVDALPLTAMDKVDKRALRARLTAGAG